MIIEEVENPIIDDFYTLSGTDIPRDAVVRFRTAAGTVSVEPDFVRPHLALIERLPATIPTGPVQVDITSPSTASSNTIATNVTGGAAQTVRVLHAGAPKAEPYTIAFVANPAIDSEFGFVADPVMTDRHAFQETVTNCFHGLFEMAESLLRENDIDAQMRFVSVFDPTRPVTASNSLASEIFGDDIMETRFTVIPGFLNNFSLTADVVFVIHGSFSHKRASAWFTKDDSARPGTNYTFDGIQRRHGHFARIPGSSAISTSLDPAEPVVIHEFAHAASDFNNGMVIDLRDDEGIEAEFVINKKFRASSINPVPLNFANYEGTDFSSDPTRDGLGYELDWISFHPELVDATRPNLMDDYRLTAAPHLCRLDRLTAKWLRDRLNDKLSR